MSAPLSMRDTAAEVGLSYERFRKVWIDWTRQWGFPKPMARPNRARARFMWDAEAVAVWKKGRERAVGARHVAPNVATAEALPAAIADRVARERARLETLNLRSC